MKRKWLAWSLVSGILLLTSVMALNNFQSTESQVQLSSDPQLITYTLDDKTNKVTRKIRVEKGTYSLTIDSTHDPNVSFTLINPLGQTVTPSNIAPGTYTQETNSQGKQGEAIDITNPTIGDWTVVYTLKGQGTGRAALQTMVLGSNTLAAKVMVYYTQIQGRSFPISVAVYQGSSPVKDATVELTLTNWATQQDTVVVAHDDGQQNNGDAKAGDGLYSANIENLTPAFYLVTAKIKIPGQDEYMAANFFSVEDSTALLAGTVSDDGVDDDGDGQFDRIVLHFPIKEVKREGRYLIDAVLRGSNGKTISTDDAMVQLKPGSSSADIFFDAKELRQKVGVDGPYQIDKVRFDWDPESEDIRPDPHVIQDIGSLGQTKPYKLSELQGPLIQTGHYISDRGIDTNGNGQFDKIEVTFEVISSIELPFTWNASLVPVSGLAPGAVPPNAHNQGVLKPGVNTITLTFDVDSYGLNHIAGPYTLTGLTFTPQGEWPSVYENKGYDELFDIADPFGRSQSYLPNQLEHGEEVSKPHLLNIDELSTFISSVKMNTTSTLASMFRNSWRWKLSETVRTTRLHEMRLAALHLDSLAFEVRNARGSMLSQEDADLILDSIKEIRKNYPR